MANTKIDALTSLRFFAAAAIVVCHCPGHFGFPTTLGQPFELAQGVSFFFVLSGFILSLVYGRDLSEAPTWGARLKFIVARFARIWPLHVTTLVIMAFLLPDKWLASFTPGHLFCSLTLIQAWIPEFATSFAFNSVSWSLSAELFFYLMFPLLILNYKQNWWKNLAYTFGAVLFFAVLSKVLKLPELTNYGVSYHELMYVSPFTRLFEFALGISVFALSERIKSWYNARSVVTSTVFEVAALALVVFFAYKTLKISHALANFTGLGEPFYTWLKYGGSACLAFALLILVYSFQRGLVSRLLSIKPLVYLGEISFSVYLMHRMLLHYYYDHFSTIEGFAPCALYWLVLLASSQLLYEFVECPFRSAIVSGYKSWNQKDRSGSIRDWLPKLRLTRLSTALSMSSLAFLLVVPSIVYHGPRLAFVEPFAPGVNTSVLGKFGDSVELVSAQYKGVDSSGTKHLELTWRSLKEQKLLGFVGVQLYTPEQVYYKRRDYKRSNHEEMVQPGQVWVDKVALSADEGSQTAQVRLSIYGIGADLGSLEAKLLDGEGASSVSTSQLSVAIKKGALSL
jgi:peptidoglycan/LPS O-acetylase OafA/YrhL